MAESENYTRRMNAKEIWIRQKRDEFILPFADGIAQLSGRDYEFREPTVRRDNAARGENLRGEFQGEPEESQPTELKDDAEVVPTSGRLKVTSSIAITMNLEFNSMCRKKKTFPIPLKNIDVTRSTH